MVDEFKGGFELLGKTGKSSPEELSPEDLAAIAALNEEKMTLEYPENCGY